MPSFRTQRPKKEHSALKQLESTLLNGSDLLDGSGAPTLICAELFLLRILISPPSPPAAYIS